MMAATLLLAVLLPSAAFSSSAAGLGRR
eukprot:SAG22_NODE_14161_length_383_cov_0.545775_1_plen_27_part_01